MRAAPRVLLASAVVVAIYVGLSALMTLGFEHWQKPVLLLQDRETLWRLRPGYSGPPDADGDAHLVPVQIDARGFRRIETSGSVDGRRDKILVMGDSFVFGWDVADAETFPAQLQTILDRRTPGRFEVINGGMPGCTSFQALRLLRRWLPQLKPALLVLLVGRNDGRGGHVSDAAAQNLLRWKPGILNYVFPFMFVHYQNLNWMAEKVGRGNIQRVSDQEFHDNMEEIAALASANGMRLIVMQHWARTAAFRLSGFADAHHLAYIDTPKLLADAGASGEELFIRAHYHPNAKGHAVIAAALADEIERGN